MSDVVLQQLFKTFFFLIYFFLAFSGTEIQRQVRIPVTIGNLSELIHDFHV